MQENLSSKNFDAFQCHYKKIVGKVTLFSFISFFKSVILRQNIESNYFVTINCFRQSHGLEMSKMGVNVKKLK